MNKIVGAIFIAASAVVFALVWGAASIRNAIELHSYRVRDGSTLGYTPVLLRPEDLVIPLVLLVLGLVFLILGSAR